MEKRFNQIACKNILYLKTNILIDHPYHCGSIVFPLFFEINTHFQYKNRKGEKMETFTTKPQTIVINNKDYEIEFDNKGYEFLEFCLQKNIFKIFNEFVIEESLDSLSCVELTCAGLMKHHTKEEIKEAKENLKTNKSFLFHNIDLIKLAYVEPLLAPSNMPKEENGTNNKKETQKNLSKKKK